MAEGLVKDTQTDFSAGAHPLYARDEIPRNGFEDGVNLLISNDGLPYRRGGSAYKGSDPALILTLAPNPGGYLLDANLVAGPRTLGNVRALAGPFDQLVVIDPADDTTLRALSGAGLSLGLKPALLKNLLFTPGSRIYAGYVPGGAGSLPAGGNITLTNGSTTVVGTSGTWTAGTGPRGLIVPADDLHYAVVSSVTDATHLELVEPWAGATMTISFAVGAQIIPGAWHDPPHAGYVSGSQMGVLGAVGTRMFMARGGGSGPQTPIPENRVHQSLRGEPKMMLASNYWDLPKGAQILSIEGIRDTAIVFSTKGVYGIYNTALDLTDAAGNVQQRLEEITADLILWSALGVTGARGRLIVPALDAIYLFSPAAGPVDISSGISALYRSYVDAGYQAGRAVVYRDHYKLPILDSAGAVIDNLVCRLSATRRGRGDGAYGWTRHAGHGGRMAAFAVRSRSGSAPSLLGMHGSSARIETLSPFNAATVPLDADATAHVAVLTTREFTLGNGVKNFFARLRMRYELAGSTPPTVSAQASADGAAAVALTSPSANAPTATLASPKTWVVRKRGLGVRFILTSAGSATNFIVHSLEAMVRPSGKP